MKVHPLIKSNLRFFSTFLVLFPIAFSAEARLTAMQDKDLSRVIGQSMFKISTNEYDGLNGKVFKGTMLKVYTKLTLDANIDKVMLGNYERFGNPDMDKCNPGNGKCKRITPGLANFMCSHNECLPHADIEINNLSIGRIIDGEISPLSVRNPYIELITRDDGGVERFAGVRFGVGQDGAIGGYLGLGDGDGIKSLSGRTIASVGDKEKFLVDAFSVRSEFAARWYGEEGKLGLGTLSWEKFNGVRLDNVGNFYISFMTDSIKFPQFNDTPGITPTGFFSFLSAEEIPNSTVNVDLGQKTKNNKF